MLKIRYFQVEVPGGISGFIATIHHKHRQDALRSVQVSESSSEHAVLSYAASRVVPIHRLTEDGRSITESVSTVDVYSVRLFSKNKLIYLCVIDPPRGARVISNLLDEVCGEAGFFIEPVEFTRTLIGKHIALFDVARLVSAKVRDFAVYDGAVGRLEISSQNGLLPNIAPFLENKFHRVDALTYEVSQKFTQGLVYYYRNGTLKITEPLADLALSSFEACL